VKISEQQVRYVADLANLNLTAAEVTQFRDELEEILDHMDRLKEIDTEGVDAMAQVLFDAAGTETLREDQTAAPLGNAVALANAPQPGGGYFKVPKVIER
jgi:aspartyl-tRNA(Asn)/glutamyl-tRNA(Gln) amidotransferase subunit C